jgi:hypothetical protein
MPKTGRLTGGDCCSCCGFSYSKHGNRNGDHNSADDASCGCKQRVSFHVTNGESTT